MLNVQKSKNKVSISNISIISFLEFPFYYTQAAGTLTLRLEAILHKAKTHEAEAKTHEVEAEAKTEAKTHEAEARFFGLKARPRGLTSLLGLNK